MGKRRRMNKWKKRKRKRRGRREMKEQAKGWRWLIKSRDYAL